MIDWKEIYEQVAPLFDTYYQWQVGFVVGEGLFLVLANYLIYRFIKGRFIFYFIALLFILADVYFVYKAYHQINASIQVVKYQELPANTNCLIYNKERIINNAILPMTYSIEKANQIFTFNENILIQENATISRNIWVKNQINIKKSFWSFYSQILDNEKIIKTQINSLKKIDTNLNSMGKEQIQCEETLIKPENYFRKNTYTIGIRRNYYFYPLMLITKQGEIIYKITHEELKEYISETNTGLSL